jgi:protein-tyrosine phosphatase
MKFRTLDFADRCSGRVLLHSMPGRLEEWSAFENAARLAQVRLIVSLAPLSEIREKSPDYADRIVRPGRFWDFLNLPISDYGVPRDIQEFNAAMYTVLQRLRDGQTVLAHCAAGIGRTGTFAASLLTALGYSVDEAVARVLSAGSHAETPSQMAFIAGFAAQFKNPSA